jgi:hypothetical protein
MMSLGHHWGWQPPQTAPPIHLSHSKSVWAHWCAVHWHTVAALHSYPPYLAQILGFWVTYGVEMKSVWHGWGWQPPQTASCIYIGHIKSVWEHWYAVHRHKVAALHSYPPYLAQISGFWITYGVEMISLGHGWGWQPPQTASCIYIGHIKSVWAHWYAIHSHKVEALPSYPPYFAQILGLWVTYVESNCCHYVMVDADDSHLKLLPATMYDIYKVFGHIAMLSIGIG